jgi:hypothetical protein
MFVTEFSQLLIDTLTEVAKDIPALKESIQERLLIVLSSYLINKESPPSPLKTQSNSNKDLGPLTPASNGTLSSSVQNDNPLELTSINVIILTLSLSLFLSFSFSLSLSLSLSLPRLIKHQWSCFLCTLFQHLNLTFI